MMSLIILPLIFFTDSEHDKPLLLLLLQGGGAWLGITLLWLVIFLPKLYIFGTGRGNTKTFDFKGSSNSGSSSTRGVSSTIGESSSSS